MLLSNMELIATAPGGIAKLRELILTLAVQGKLVPQNPADEPAGVLLKKIRAEKDRLVAEGKIKRDKPLAEIAEEEKPFELPVGWEWVRLGTLVDPRRTITYGVLKPGADEKDGIPLVKTENVQFNRVLLHFNSRITPALDEEYKRTRLLGGEVLITLVGSIGRCAIAPNEIAGANLSRSVGMVVPVDGANKQFMVYSLTALISPKFVDENCAGTAQKVLNIGTVDSMLYPLPPLAEQSRIVTRVEALMLLCDALEAKGQLEAAQHAQLVSTLLGTLTASTAPDELADNWQRVAQHFDLLLDRPEAIDALEQTLLQLAVRGLLVPQDPTDEPASALLQKIRAEKDRLIATGQIKRDKPLPPITDEEKPFELPVGWEWVRLGDVALQGPSNGLSPKPQELPTDLRCLSLSATTQGFFKPECFKYVDVSSQAAQQFFLKNGDLLIQRGNSLEYVGIAAIYDGPDDGYIYPDLMMRLQLSTCVKTEFIHTMLVCADGRSYFQRNATGTQGTMPKVNQATVAGAPIPLPPLAEQSRIVTRITALRRLCADLRQRLAERQSVQARLAEALVQEVA